MKNKVNLPVTFIEYTNKWNGKIQNIVQNIARILFYVELGIWVWSKYLWSDYTKSYRLLPYHIACHIIYHIACLYNSMAFKQLC